MPPRQIILAVTLSLGLLVFIIEAVRRRRLREEYAWLWLLVGVVMLLLALWPGLVDFLTRQMGIELPINTVFFFGMIFVIFINLHFSIKVSHLTNQVKRLTQEIALLKRLPPRDPSS